MLNSNLSSSPYSSVSSSIPPFPNLYQILDCPQNTPSLQIKTFFQNKQQYILDSDGVLQTQSYTDEAISQLNNAYCILRNEGLRLYYDRFEFEGVTPISSDEIEAFRTIQQILGQLSSPKYFRSSIRVDLEKVPTTFCSVIVPLRYIITGGDLVKKVEVHEICSKCDGIGSNNGIEYPICPVCQGKGSLAKAKSLHILFPCERCDGIGYLMPVNARCPKCHAEKVINVHKEVLISIEPGMPDGKQIVIQGAGDQYPGKEEADLVLLPTIHDRIFFREGNDLVCVKKLSTFEEKHGTAFSLKIPDGERAYLDTEEGEPINLNRVQFVRHFGLPDSANPKRKGDLYVIFCEGWKGPFVQAARMISSSILKGISTVHLRDAPEDKQQLYFKHVLEAHGPRSEHIGLSSENHL